MVDLGFVYETNHILNRSIGALAAMMHHDLAFLFAGLARTPLIRPSGSVCVN